MSAASSTDPAPSRRRIVQLRAENWLALAAAPTFALMALLNAAAPVDPAAVICGSAGVSPMHGMPIMYLLMSAFHLRPWMRVVRPHHRRARH